jgi:hypothetical protein
VQTCEGQEGCERGRGHWTMLVIAATNNSKEPKQVLPHAPSLMQVSEHGVAGSLLDGCRVGPLVGWR